MTLEAIAREIPIPVDAFGRARAYVEVRSVRPSVYGIWFALDGGRVRQHVAEPTFPDPRRAARLASLINDEPASRPAATAIPRDPRNDPSAASEPEQLTGSTGNLSQQTEAPAVATAGRFWRYVDASRGLDGCWPWLGGCDRLGYGRFGLRRAGRSGHIPAHRFSLQVALGRPLALHEHACHTCDNPPYVNPAHLFAGSRADNMDDMTAKGRNPKAKLTLEAAEAVRERHAQQGISGRAIARELGVDGRTISRILRGEAWRGRPDQMACRQPDPGPRPADGFDPVSTRLGAKSGRRAEASADLVPGLAIPATEPGATVTHPG